MVSFLCKFIVVFSFFIDSPIAFFCFCSSGASHMLSLHSSHSIDIFQSFVCRLQSGCLCCLLCIRNSNMFGMVTLLSLPALLDASFKHWVVHLFLLSNSLLSIMWSVSSVFFCWFYVFLCFLFVYSRLDALPHAKYFFQKTTKCSWLHDIHTFWSLRQKYVRHMLCENAVNSTNNRKIMQLPFFSLRMNKHEDCPLATS